MKVTIIAPTLNEIDGIKEVLPRIKSEWYDQLVILDGNSSDGTLEWCKSQGYEVYKQKEKGLWNGYRELFKSGVVKGDIIITFSPDGNSVSEMIPRLVELVENNCDMAIASRYSGTAKSYDDTRLTAFGNWALNQIMNLLIGTHFTDSLVMFRAYRKDVIDKLGFLGEVPKPHKWLQKISNLASWEPPLSVRCARSKMRVIEISSDEPARIDGITRRVNPIRHGFILLTQILYEGIFRKHEK